MKNTIHFKNKKGIQIFTCVSGKLNHLRNDSLNILKKNTEINRLYGQFSLDSTIICYLQYKLLM